MFANLVTACVFLWNAILIVVPIAFFGYLLQTPITDESVFTGPILAYGVRMTIVGLIAFSINATLLFIAWRNKFTQTRTIALSFGVALVIYLILCILSDRYAVAHMIKIVIE